MYNIYKPYSYELLPEFGMNDEYDQEILDEREAYEYEYEGNWLG